jgi:DNA-binding NarL/FixJ family response regulator
MSDDHTIRVILVDEQYLFREGIELILDGHEDIHLLGGASTVETALELIAEHKPDIVITSIRLSGKSGLELLDEINTRYETIRCIILSMYKQVPDIIRAFRGGAAGYLTKETTGKCVVDAIRAVDSGEFYMDSIISEKVIAGISRVETHRKREDEGLHILSLREQEVLKEICDGATTQEIADRLFISSKTTGNYKSKIMKKLGVSTDLELVKKAVQLGIIDVKLWLS